MQLDESVRNCFQGPQTYIKSHPPSPLPTVPLDMLGSREYPMTLDALDSLYHSLDDTIQNSEAGLKYADKLQKLKTQPKLKIKESKKKRKVIDLDSL